MARPALPRPTDGDIEILKALWEHGPLSVRGIYLNMGESRRGAIYNSILKRIQIMEDKGYLIREPNTRPAIYRPAVPKAKTQQHLISDLTRRVFGGSVSSLVLGALGKGKISPSELALIRSQLDKADKKS